MIYSFSPLNHDSVAVQVANYFQMHNTVHMTYTVYLFDVLFRVSWIVLNMRFDLVAVNDCMPAGTFLIFHIKISTSETLKNSAVSYLREDYLIFAKKN